MSPPATGDNAADNAKRRRACDICRRSKIKCNVSESDDAPCAHCTRFKLECTFVQDSKRRTPAKGYLICLENRCKQLELLIKRISPHTDIDAEVGPSFTQDTWSKVVATDQRARSSTSSAVPSTTQSIDTANQSPNYRMDNEEDIKDRLQKDLADLRLDKDDPSRFHGKSSGFDLIRVAMNLKDNAVGNTPGTTMKSASPRLKFWAAPEWKKMITTAPPMTTIIWPPDDLLELLVNLYFTQNAFLLPILYRPSFDRNLKAGLHKTDINFAKLLLAVCALASQCCDDPRVCIPDANNEPEWASAGWKYFGQLLAMHQTLFGPSSLTTLQTCAIVCMFLHHVGFGHVSWLLSGIGIRFALDIGLHREKVYAGDQPLENQLWKRTFWALIGADIMKSSRLGRPTAVPLDEIDAELPMEVSDEYYDEVGKQWHHHAGEPRRISGFVQFIKLEKVIGRALQTVYAVRHPSLSVVADLDNALSKWLEELPSHLRWDPTTRDFPYQKESAILRLTFLHTQITVHRRFLPAMLRDGEGESSALSASALAICTTSAQAIVRVLESMEQLGRSLPMAGVAFGAATILLLNIWDTQRKGPLNVDISSHMQDVQRCIRVLRASESRSKHAGRLVDLLTELSSMKEAPLWEAAPTARSKRTRDGIDDEGETTRLPHGFQPEVRGMAPSSASFHEPQTPSISLNPVLPDSSSIQWDSQPTGPSAVIDSYPVAGFDPQGLGGYPLELNASYSGLALPNDTLQYLFGNVDGFYSGTSQLPSTAHDLHGSGFDWATEFNFFGMNAGTGDATGSFNP